MKKKSMRCKSLFAVALEIAGFKNPPGCDVPAMAIIVEAPNGRLFGAKFIDFSTRRMYQYSVNSWYFANRRQARDWLRKEIGRMRENNMRVFKGINDALFEHTATGERL